MFLTNKPTLYSCIQERFLEVKDQVKVWDLTYMYIFLSCTLLYI